VARSYHVGIAAVVAAVDAKWIDNLLSRFDIPGVDHARQGVTRRISVGGLREIVLIRRLTESIGVPLPRAVTLAHQILSSPNGAVEVDELALTVDLQLLDRTIEAALSDAVETIAPARRGRPPRR
jgi:hypothetical protein